MLSLLAERFPDTASLSEEADFVSPLRHARLGAGAPAAAPRQMPLIPADQPAAIAFTSGSTGEPAGTMKRFGELAARSRAAGACFGFSEEAPVTIVGTVPPHHMYGFETTVLLPLYAAAASWCDPVFYPADLPAPLAAAGGRGVLVTTPLQLRAMQAAPLPHPPQMVISATAPLEAALAAQVERQWGTEVFEIFGATELGSIASRRTCAGPDWSVYPGLRLSSDDPPWVSAPGAPARQLSDVIEVRGEGRMFRFLGRAGDIVKLGGRRASLAGLTRILTGLHGVSDGVFIAPDDLDSRPTARLAALVVSPDLPGEAVLEALRARIDPVFMPRPLVRVRDLPRDGLGKLPRRELLALLGSKEGLLF